LPPPGPPPPNRTLEVFAEKFAEILDFGRRLRHRLFFGLTINVSMKAEANPTKLSRFVAPRVIGNSRLRLPQKTPTGAQSLSLVAPPKSPPDAC
jgi:hypothetical protein